MVSSFSLICLVSITGGGDDALPVVPDQERNNWQSEQSSKEQDNFTEEVMAHLKAPVFLVAESCSKMKQVMEAFISELTRVTPVRSHASNKA